MPHCSVLTHHALHLGSNSVLLLNCAASLTASRAAAEKGKRIAEVGTVLAGSVGLCSVTISLIVAFQYSKRVYKQERDRLSTWSDSDRTMGNGFKLEESRFRLHVGKKILYSDTGYALALLSRELWVPHIWRCWPGWMGPWVPWAGGGQPCSWKVVATGWALRTLPTQQVILWLYDSVILWRH